MRDVCCLVTFDFWLLTFDLWRLTLGCRLSTFYFLRWTSDVWLLIVTFEIRRLAFDFRLSIVDSWLLTFDFRLSTFDFWLLTVDFWLQLLTFDFRRSTHEFWLVMFDFWPSTFDFRLLTFERRGWGGVRVMVRVVRVRSTNNPEHLDLFNLFPSSRDHLGINQESLGEILNGFSMNKSSTHHLKTSLAILELFAEWLSEVIRIMISSRSGASPRDQGDKIDKTEFYSSPYGALYP